ncbi:acetyl-CoA carboxylase carboxyl transferase subunit beta [Suicoccus acidiformans]|uniref:Acetyl-coenzyme A carboxylase carboxyl transferase subunit beta n=1 Tax=Suicoccus acidiformans TaxID=2036206 RepID=A0A347WJE8_9LACT|nr:acetyl-CoA carboxylase, carboxyltransferase subunit beta [Suicoccus acidiformans]AXY25205.1 acetyl-CoA carboxylase carboxyl transferase subunit beta [Suicoccus acidiformans]
MALFRKKESIRLNPILPQNFTKKREELPDDLVKRCPSCRRVILQKDITQDRCCPNCQHHFQFPAQDRIEWLVDEGSFMEWDSYFATVNPLDFPDYQEKLEAAQDVTGLNEAVVTGEATIRGNAVSLGVMDSRFIMASMGSVVGEKLTRLFEKATERELPVILYVASGGARMQEGILSLMQMAKVSQAVSQHSQAGLLYVSVLTNPTTGGVTASFGMQADITLAEPKATIGFAGKRVIAQTMQAELPEDFQEAERVLQTGFVDQIIARSEQHDALALILNVHK